MPIFSWWPIKERRTQGLRKYFLLTEKRLENKEEIHRRRLGICVKRRVKARTAEKV
jgi:hypothetical protein